MTKQLSKLNIKRKNGKYVGRPYSGVKVEIWKSEMVGGYIADISINKNILTFKDRPDYPEHYQIARDYLHEVGAYIDYLGDLEVYSKNLMSDKTMIMPLRMKGGCCDPSTETYWSM
jgi:hypothetical protein